MELNRISKPLLTSLLRVFHARRYLVPHIRFASIRSKPELCKDLGRYFETTLVENIIHFLPRSNVPRSVPAIQFDLKAKHFLFDGVPVEVPTVSRQHPRFVVHHGPVTLTFP